MRANKKTRVRNVALALFLTLVFVPRAGIEPAHLAVLDFESSASTNSATWAWTWNRKKSVSEAKDSVFIQIANLFPNIFLILEVFF